MEYKREKTIDYKFSELCDEVDKWKEEAEYWKSKYEEGLEKNIEQTNENLEMAQKGVANALSFALSCKNDENGNLVILSEDRKKLAKGFE